MEIDCLQQCEWKENVLTIPKSGLHTKKLVILACYFQTLNSYNYCSQSQQLKETIDEKRPKSANRNGVVFHQDNDRLHVDLKCRQE